MKKKFIILSLIVSMLSMNTVSADTSAIKDIAKSSVYARNAIQYLAQNNIVSGDEFGNFNPQKNVTRAEMVVLLVKAMKLDIPSDVQSPTFGDVPQKHWASLYVEAAYREGIISGVNTTQFKPEDQITREQMAVMFVRALKILDQDNRVEINNINAFEDKANIASWAQKEVEVALEAGLMNGVSGRVFEPKTNANKEQAAVVIERLIKNRTQIIERFLVPSENQQAVKLLMNKENVILKNKIVSQNGQLYIPVEFLNKFIQEAVVYDIDEGAETFALIPGIEYAGTGFKSLWMKVGSTTAYKNPQENPYEGSTSKGEQMNLQAAPIQLEGKTYVPVKDIFNLFDMTYSFDAESNTLIVQNDKIGQNPNLYFALKQLAYGDFVGEVYSTSKLKLTDENTEASSEILFEMTSKQNGKDTLWAQNKETTEVSGQEPQVVQRETIVINGNQYEKDFAEDKWIQSPVKQDSINGYTPLYDPIYEKEEIKNREMNAILFDCLWQLPVKNEGTVYLGGAPTTKYVISLDLSSIKNTMSEADYATVKEFAQAAFDGKVNYQYEFYVSNGHIVKQTYEFKGKTTVEATQSPLNYYANTVISYKNLGIVPAITIPAM